MESEICDKYSTFGSLRRIKDIRKVDGEADLCAETGTGDVFASEHSKTESQSFADKVLAPDHALELRSP